GYKQALKLAGIEKSSNLITFCVPSFNVEDGYKAAKRLLTEKRQNPTAIFAATDLLAIGAIRAVRELGKEVPGDISVVGFDDEETAEHIIPALTTVRIHKHRMGVESGRKLIQMIENASNFPTKTVLFTDLVIRDSAGPYNQK
ncbi:MAG TPA: LacI family transcriptional regulator, partial [Natronincola sp.]|nr:LacI family transcriptional regulator [Natronincola sp.]